MTASAPVLTPCQRRQIYYVLIPTSLIVAIAFVIAHRSHGALATWMDNLHWTVAYAAAVIMAFKGVRWADRNDAAPRRWFAYGLTGYFIGQLLWNLECALDWFPYPTPSDFLFMTIGPCSAYAMWLTYRIQGRLKSHRAVALDALTLAAVVLTAVLVLYLPQRGTSTLDELLRIATYPVCLLIASCVGLVMIPTLKLKFSWSWLLLFVALLCNGFIWMKWLLNMLVDTNVDGSWLNLSFSIVALGIGLGTAMWHVESTANPRWERYSEGLLRMLPLLVTGIAVLSVCLVWLVPHTLRAVALSVTLCAAVTLALAIVRQSLLLYEREQLIAAEHRAGELEQTFRALFYATRDGLALIDADGQLLEVNAACEDIFGYRRDELLTMNLVQLLRHDTQSGAPDAHAVATRHITKLMETSRAAPRESAAQHKSGQMLYLELSSIAVAVINGHWIVELRDITERKRAENAQALLEAQLRQSQKLEAIGTLASGIAHDFNNILSVILGNIDLALVDGNQPQAQHMSLQQARKAVHRARDLIGRIVAFARPQESQREALPLSDVVDDALKLLRATLPDTVKIRSDLPPDLPLVIADSSQIFQVLLNLCTNAYQAMPQQRGEIAVSLRLFDADTTTMTSSDIKAGLHTGRYVRLCVKDNGSGIDPAIVERIFEPFFTTKPVGQGSGLGLSIVHSIVRAHHGAITVDSAPGRGTAFNIFIPVADGQRTELQPASSSLPTASGAGQHILCVDDEEALVFLLSRLLERWGYRVSGHTTPDSALAALRSDTAKFDLIITDFTMPGMSGMEFAHEALQLQPTVPIVLISGYILKHEIDAARAAGIKDVLLKPDSVDELAKTIHRLLSEDAVDA